MTPEQDVESPRSAAHREMFTHLNELRERCDSLLAARDPFTLCNSLHGLRSLVGQMGAAARRYETGR